MKAIHGCYYVHRSAWTQLPNKAAIVSAWQQTPFDFIFEMIKYNSVTGAVTFSECHDWDTAWEPTQGDSWLIRSDGSTKFIKQPKDPFVYHHKHLFVDSTYTGFDIDKSKARSEAMSEVILKLDKPYIGRKSWWETLLGAEVWRNKKPVKVREILDAATQ